MYFFKCRQFQQFCRSTQNCSNRYDWVLQLFPCRGFHGLAGWTRSTLATEHAYTFMLTSISNCTKKINPLIYISALSHTQLNPCGFCCFCTILLYINKSFWRFCTIPPLRFLKFFKIFYYFVSFFCSGNSPTKSNFVDCVKSAINLLYTLHKETFVSKRLYPILHHRQCILCIFCRGFTINIFLNTPKNEHQKRSA